MNAWLQQRLSAIALIPLFLFFIFQTHKWLLVARNDAIAWLACPINTTLVILLMLALAVHVYHGLASIITDYIKCRHLNSMFLTLCKGVLFFLVMISIVATVKIMIVSHGL